MEEVWSAGRLDEPDEDYLELDRQVQDLAAECMTNLGFDYIPVDTTAGDEAYQDPHEVLSDLEYAQQYGYGFTTMDYSAPGAEAQEDPNAETIAAMTEVQQQAWYEALYGPEPELDEEGNSVGNQDLGCWGNANEEIYNGDDEHTNPWDGIYSDPRFIDLFANIDAMYERTAQSVELIELRERWSSCMAEAGYPDLADPTAASEAFNLTLYEHYEINADGDYVQPSDAVMADLRNQEIAMATADATCQQEVDYMDTYLTIQFEAEQTFIDANRAEIDALIAVLNDTAR